MAKPMEVQVPDIGDFKDVPVIEIHVKPGDSVKAEDSLVTLESDKATLDVPAPCAGVVKEVKLQVGDKVSEGSLVVLLEPAAAETFSAKDAEEAKRIEPAQAEKPLGLSGILSGEKAAAAGGEVCELRPTEAEPTTAPPSISLPTPAEVIAQTEGGKPHASPSVRHLARELGVDLARVAGSGPKGRITHEDVHAFVKAALAGGPAPAPATSGSGPLNLPPWPQVDFAKFGPVETIPLSRIKKISGPNLARNWVMIPAVTYHEEADVTDLEAFRKEINQESAAKVTLLAFIVKACVAALQRYPELNSSLDGDKLILKHHWHIGFAADTPSGLVVPVLKDADRKGLLEIAGETADLAARAREGKLAPAQMQGATFTVSSLGGIGGTAFSPIVNAPEVAILGVSRGQIKPCWNGREFVPRLMLPLSLSADHRVVDGALASRFNAYLARLLADFRRISL